MEDQGIIKDAVDKHGTENLMVVLGTPDAESAGIFAETVTIGDPAFSGPLAGVSLGLPVYHVLEPEVKEAADPDVFEEEVAMMEISLDVEAISKEVSRFREKIDEIEDAG